MMSSRPSRTYGLHPFNPLKLLAHANRASRLLAGEPVFPVSVELDLSLRCNHGCDWCSFDGWRQRNWVNFPTERALTLIDELAECGVRSITLTGGGEPLVHPDAGKVMQRIAARGLEWGLVTNGFLLRPDIRATIAASATFVRVSLDAGRTETHQRIHKAPAPQLGVILRQMNDLVREAPALTVGASFCVFDSNIDEIQTAALLLKAIGARYLEVRPVYPTTWRGGRQDDAGISDENIARAQAEIAEAKARYDDVRFSVIGMIDRFEAVQSFRHRDYYDACRITGLSTVISADGNLYACCVHRGLEPFKGGSVLNQPFRDVWLSEQRASMVAGIEIDKCPKCRYVGLNAVLQSLQNDDLHQNFI